MKLGSWLAIVLFSASAMGCALGDPARPGSAGGSSATPPSRSAEAEGQGAEADNTAPPSSPSPPPSPSASPSSPAAPAFATAGEQIAAGQKTFANVCARCHGADGSGARAPRLIGLDQGALGSFANAEEVSSYVASNMPVSSKPEAYAVVAWVLQQNGVANDRVLDETVAKDVALR
jgi:cytochrome c553